MVGGVVVGGVGGGGLQLKPRVVGRRCVQCEKNAESELRLCMYIVHVQVESIYADRSCDPVRLNKLP